MTYINRNVSWTSLMSQHDPGFWLQVLCHEPAGRQWCAEPDPDSVLCAKWQLERFGQGDGTEWQEDRRRGQQLLAAMVSCLQWPRAWRDPKLHSVGRAPCGRCSGLARVLGDRGAVRLPQALDIAIDFVNAATGQTNLTLTRSINAGAAITANTRSGGEFDPNQIAAALGNVWAGSVIVRSTNNTNLAVIAYSIRSANNQASGTSAATIEDRARDLSAGSLSKEYPERLLPVVGFGLEGFFNCPDAEPGTVNANDVDIYYFNLDGSLVVQELDRQVQAGKSLSRHTL